MNIEEKRALLLQRRGALYNEIKDIRDEVVVLLTLIKKAEEEIETIDAKLSKVEYVKKVKLAQAS